ncbi:hypothetical protein BSL78_06125 [Apostichopus japonicus]|uniref:Uncharacterized protein n=1 Tax=Stichopus japonicus TaxID=307972 RepID=A0A2G8L9S2_STIJA|nr:hypothetical protein BSL78_06125 [Apostichopus japonicus]
MHKLIVILLLAIVAMAAFVASQEDVYDEALMTDLFEEYKRKSRTKACIKYGGNCKVDSIYRNNCCRGYSCRGPAGVRCFNKECVCQKHDKLAFLFS